MFEFLIGPFGELGGALVPELLEALHYINKTDEVFKWLSELL